MNRETFSTWRVAAMALALVSSLACGSSSPTDPPRACTLIGCEDGLKVDLEPGSGWPAGEYRFSLDVDGTAVTCRGSLPLPSCSAGRALTCEPTGIVTIAESGCALPAGAQGFPQLMFDPALRPKRVRVSIVRRQGSAEPVIGTADLAPAFQTSQPNGPDCPPLCTQARGRVNVSF